MGDRDRELPPLAVEGRALVLGCLEAGREEIDVLAQPSNLVIAVRRQAGAKIAAREEANGVRDVLDASRYTGRN